MASGSREKSSDVWSRFFKDDRFIEAATDPTKHAATIKRLSRGRMLSLVLFIASISLILVWIEAGVGMGFVTMFFLLCLYLDILIKVLKAFEAMEPTPDPEQHTQ